jgi:hypothetical protein
MGTIPWLLPAVGFGAGALFLFGLVKLLPHLPIYFDPSRMVGPPA